MGAWAGEPTPEGDPQKAGEPAAAAGPAAPGDSAVETQPPKPVPAAAPADAAMAQPTLKERWLKFVNAEAERIRADHPYGATFQLPRGWTKVGYRWASLRGNSRFDGTGKLGPVVPPLSFKLNNQPE